MQEIGGYFGHEQSHGSAEYYPKLIALNTARNALAYICRAKRISKIYLPYFLCDTAYLICQRENVDYEFYHVTEDFRPITDKNICADGWIYIVNYYGILSNKDILSFKKEYKNIIVDNVQAFFQEPIEGIDTIYSCRKFFGVPDGAYLATDCYLNGLEKDNSDTRLAHVFGRITDGANAHYSDYQRNEELLCRLPLLEMSDRTHEMLSDIDYDFCRKRRESNFCFLMEELSEFNLLNIPKVIGPFAYPLKVENGTAVRKCLQEKKIYVPCLWPNVTEGYESEMAQNILPLPCDQRYGREDMRMISRTIFDIIRKRKIG